MTDVESQNPNLDRPANCRVEELDEDDVGKSPKQTKRRREEFYESAAGTENSTLWNKEPPMVDDGSADGSSLVLPQKEDTGSGGNEDSDVEEVSATEEDSDSADFILDYGGGVDEGDYFGYCELCVDNEVCKGCGNKDGSPVREEERLNPLECRICCTSEHRTEYCEARLMNKWGKEQEEREKMMLSRSGESGQVPKPAKTRRKDEIPTHGTTIIFIKTNELVIVGSDSRCSNCRSNRIVNDDGFKIEAITSNIYATCTGLFSAAQVLFEDLRKQYMEKKNSGVEPTLKEIADYGRQRIWTWDNGVHYNVIGTENGKPQAYGFVDKDKYKDSVALKTWWSFGSGAKYAKLELNANYNWGMSEPLALNLAETAFLAAALGDPFTGGYLRVFVFDSNGLRKEYSKTTLELYLSYYSLSDEFHSRTIYIFSRGQIGDTVVTQWFSSGCLIEPVDVMVVHSVGYIGGYIVRRVVFQEKDAATIIQEVQHQCERYGCRDRTDEEINTFPCLQIVNERFHFAKLTKEQLSNLLRSNA